MKLRLLVLTMLTMLIASFAFAQKTGDEKSSSTAMSGFLPDFLGQIDYVQKEIMELEQAVPQEKFSWRPSEGVRSVSEVYMHISFGNYLLMKFAGYDPPADLKESIDVTKIEKWDASMSDKTKIAETLKNSFDHLKTITKKMSDAELEKKVDFFGQQMTIRNMMMSSLSHLHEHLGQSIAYARMNGIVPPWTAAEQAAQQKEKEKK